MTVGADQRRRYAERIERVVAHIERALDVGRAPDARELASVAALSEFHFQRIYRLMTGETLGQTVRRLRIARGLPSLQGSGAVTDAAGAAGYSTGQAYARAFREQTGTSPTSARRDRQAEQIAQDLARGGDPEVAAISVEIVNLEPFRVAAIRNIGAYAELNRSYERLFERVLAERRPDEILGIYGMPLDDDRFIAAEECRFDCGLRLETAREPLGTRWIDAGGGLHARLRHLGSYDELQESYDLLYMGVMGSPDLEIADRPLLVHYLDDPETRAEADLRSDLLLPLAEALTLA